MAANQGRPINTGGWYHIGFLPWIQNQYLKKSLGYGICLGLFLEITNYCGHGLALLLLLCLMFVFLTWMDDFLPWIQNQDLRKSFGYGIYTGLFLGIMNNFGPGLSRFAFMCISDICIFDSVLNFFLSIMSMSY